MLFTASAGASHLEKATGQLIGFLQDKAYFDVNLDEKKQGEIMECIRNLAQKYGQKELGFGRSIPTTLKPALKYFNLDVTPTSKHAKCDQIIHMPTITEQN